MWGRCGSGRANDQRPRYCLTRSAWRRAGGEMGKRGRLVAAPLPMYVRRRPTLPQPLGCSTIGAERLNFRVRYGTGCFPFAMAAVTLAEHTHPLLLGWWGCSKLLVIRIQF